MKIYFENGRLLPQPMLPFHFNRKIDAAEGYSYCEDLMWKLKETNPDCVVYTNMVTLLSNTYAWNKELGVPEIYMRNDNGEFTRIDKLAQGQIRYAQNVMAMYRAGVFGNIWEEHMKGYGQK